MGLVSKRILRPTPCSYQGLTEHYRVTRKYSMRKLGTSLPKRYLFDFCFKNWNNHTKPLSHNVITLSHPQPHQYHGSDRPLWQTAAMASALFWWSRSLHIFTCYIINFTKTFSRGNPWKKNEPQKLVSHQHRYLIFRYKTNILSMRHNHLK